MQWQFRRTSYGVEFPGEFTELYLLDGATGRKHFIYGFGNQMRLSFSEGQFEIDRQDTTSDVYVYWAGLGIGYSLHRSGNAIEVYRVDFGEGFLTPAVQTPPIFAFTSSRSQQIAVAPPLELPVPVFHRDLSNVTPTQYGEDVRYLQAIIVFFHSIRIEIDGYFGSETERAVQRIQRSLDMDASGIVNERLWYEITNVSDLSLNPFMNRR